MIQCCIKNCDTDENVVNCTSVFFVSFPSDLTFRSEWLNTLTVNDALVPDTEVTAGTRICSCHFADDAFGKHPVHGYRFLLPTAVPSIFPLLEESPIIVPDGIGEDPDPDPAPSLLDDFANASDLVDDERNLIDPPPGMMIFPDEEDSDEAAEFVPVPANVLLSAAEGTAGDKPPKAIGIEYADGKYYFLQSEDEESTSDLIEQVSTLGGESVVNCPEKDGIDREDDISSLEDVDEADEDVAMPSENQFEMVISGGLDFKEEVEQVQEEEDCDALFVEEAPTEVGTDSLIEETSSLITSSEVLEAAGPECVLQDAEDESSQRMLDSMDDESIIEKETVTIYGTVEELDEPSSSKEKRIDKHFCSYCNKGFQYESALKKHLVVHTGVKPHVCVDCGKSFSQKINLTIHRRLHTGEAPVKKFTCAICDKKCIRMSELKIHLKSHWKKLPHACTLCTERFAEITNYYEHIKSEHKDEISLQESIDMIAQNENAELIVQGDEETITVDDGLYRCTVCLKRFKTEKLLKKHKRKLHPKVYVCASCPKQFLYKSLLDKHTRVHTQEKPFQCSQCDATFSQKVNLEVHLGKKHNIHVRSVQPKSFICEYCHKSFDRPSTLQIHIRTHTKERPFGCMDCPKTFASNSALATHIKTSHRGESILLQSIQRRSADNVDNIILEEQSNMSEIIEEDEDDDVKFIQYSIQFQQFNNNSNDKTDLF